MLAGVWPLLGEFVDAEVARVVRSLADDPAPLTTALWRYPTTLAHADLRVANLGVVASSTDQAPRVVLLDWARAASAPPAVDLAWRPRGTTSRGPEPR